MQVCARQLCGLQILRLMYARSRSATDHETREERRLIVLYMAWRRRQTQASEREEEAAGGKQDGRTDGRNERTGGQSSSAIIYA